MTHIIKTLEFRAYATPQKTAIQGLDYAFNYQTLWILVKNVAYKLRNMGLQPGQTVATHIVNKHVDWIIALALNHEGATSCSCAYYGKLPEDFSPNWHIADQEGSELPENTIIINSDWINKVDSASSDIQPLENHAGRLIFTSGSTGRKKIVEVNSEQIIKRSEANLRIKSVYGVEYNLFPLASAPGFTQACASLLAGTPLYFEQTLPKIVKLIEKNSLKVLYGSPHQLQGFMSSIDELNCTFKKIDTVFYTGGSISDALLNKIQQELASDVINWYGSTETGVISLYPHKSAEKNSLGIVGYLLPGNQIQIVLDDKDTVDNEHKEGILRLKTPYMSSSYVFDINATNKSFKDGWFYTGDRGYIDRGGRLVVTARQDALINRSGIKVDPVEIENFILKNTSISDVAVFGIPQSSDSHDLVIAIVSEEKINFEDLKNLMLAELGPSRVPNHYIKVKFIPRNNGKIQRKLMSEKFLAEVLPKIKSNLEN